MNSLSALFSALATVLVTACAAGAQAQAQTSATSVASATPSAPAKAQAIELLTRRAGTWDVVMTMRPTATATPIVVAELLARRSVVGPYLQEVMTPAPGSKVPDFRRIDFITYNPLQARWQYLSMDTRATVGLMVGQGVGREIDGEITVYFSDFPGPTELGPDVGGRYMRARHVLTRETNDHEFTRQYWSVDGSPEWMGIQYEYTRRTATP
jgi:hypothetical protein